jgi:hypothetical protein
MRAFLKIGGSFRIDKAQYRGPIVASADGLYLLKETEITMTAKMGAQFGLLGGLIAGAIDGMTKKLDTFVSCRLYELPLEIRQHPDWPLRKRNDCPIVYLPKEMLGTIRHPRFSNVIMAYLDDKKFRMEYRIFTGARVKEFLIGHGWPIVWAGEEHNQVR